MQHWQVNHQLERSEVPHEVSKVHSCWKHSHEVSKQEHCLDNVNVCFCNLHVNPPLVAKLLSDSAAQCPIVMMQVIIGFIREESLREVFEMPDNSVLINVLGNRSGVVEF